MGQEITRFGLGLMRGCFAVSQPVLAMPPGKSVFKKDIDVQRPFCRGDECNCFAGPQSSPQVMSKHHRRYRKLGFDVFRLKVGSEPDREPAQTPRTVVTLTSDQKEVEGIRVRFGSLRWIPWRIWSPRSFRKQC